MSHEFMVFEISKTLLLIRKSWNKVQKYLMAIFQNGNLSLSSCYKLYTSQFFSSALFFYPTVRR